MEAKNDPGFPANANPAAWDTYSKLFFPAWFAALIAIAVCMRVYGMSGLHLNSDEQEVLDIARGKTLWEVLRFSLSDPHPPFYHVLLHYWMDMSESTFFLRSLSLVFGIALIPLYYCIGKQVDGPLAGLCSAALAAFSGGLISLSFMVRDYICFLFFVSLAFYWLLRWRKERGAASLALYTVSGLLACLTHFTGIAAMFCMCSAGAFCCLCDRPVSLKRMILWLLANGFIACVSMAVYVQWHPIWEDFTFISAAIRPLDGGRIVTRVYQVPMVILEFLLPHPTNILLKVILYSGFCYCMARNSSQWKKLDFFLGLMIGALALAIGLYRANIVPMAYAGGGRHSLWLAPFIIPALAAKSAHCFAGGGAPGRQAASRRASSVAMALLAGGIAFFGPSGRIMESEPAMTEASYRRLEDFLSGMDSHSLIMADRNTGFFIAPETYDPYRYFHYWDWDDNQISRTVPLGNARILFDAHDMRFWTKEGIFSAYDDARARGLIGDAQKLVFIRQGGGWSAASNGVSHVIYCEALKKQVLTFSPGDGELAAQAVVVSRRDFEDIIMPEGKSHACLGE